MHARSYTAGRRRRWNNKSIVSPYARPKLYGWAATSLEQKVYSSPMHAAGATANECTERAQPCFPHGSGGASAGRPNAANHNTWRLPTGVRSARNMFSHGSRGASAERPKNANYSTWQLPAGVRSARKHFFARILRCLRGAPGGCKSQHVAAANGRAERAQPFSN